MDALPHGRGQQQRPHGLEVALQCLRIVRQIDLAALGIPDETAYLAAYARRTGRATLPHWEYCLVFNMFRMAAILQGIFARARQGTAASADAERTGRQARPMAEAGWRLAQHLAQRSVG